MRSKVSPACESMKQSREMEVRIEGERAKSFKVKLQPDELNVRVGKGPIQEKSPAPVLQLKAQFEEGISMVRSNRPFVVQVLGKAPEKGVLTPTCPSLDSQHPLLRSLLKLVWEAHLARFHAMTTTLESGLQMKLENTRRLKALRRGLESSANLLVESMSSATMKEFRDEFQSTWMESLSNAQQMLGVNSTDVDDLLKAALQRAHAAKIQTARMDAAEVLGHLHSEFRDHSNHLWDEWTLHMKRHRFVFAGDIQSVDRVDKELASLQRVSRSERASNASAEPKATNEVEASWTELLLFLHSVKLDFEIRSSAVTRLRNWAADRLQASTEATMTESFSAVLAQEELDIQTSRDTLTRQLEDVTVSQERVMRELTLACNNSLAPVDSILKSMHLSCELALEAAREGCYSRALHALKGIV